MVTFEQRPMWDKAAFLGWSAVAVLLLWVVAAYSAYAADVVAYRFGLDYSEGLIWQQALWMGGPHMYGNISHYPFLVFEYPPLYHIIVRLFATSGLDMLETGRAVSVASAMIAAGCVGALVFRLCTGSGRRPAAFAAGIAAMLPFTLLPVIAWSPLMRVDMLATAFTFAGVWLAVESVRNPPVVYAAMLCFVAACLTKQTFVAAPAATLVVHAMRNPRLAARAGFAAAGLGLAIVGTLSWLTNGGFLRHILLYNINRFSLAAAMQQLIPWLIGYALYAVLVGGSIALAWRQASTKRRGNGWREWVRRDSDAAILLFLTVYFVFSTATLVLAGKSGASYNYFIEFFYLWCIWIGWLIGRSLPPPRHVRAAACLPLVLAIQIAPIPGQIESLHAARLSPIRTKEWAALLNRANAIKGEILSDDMVMVLRTHREVGMDPFILAELATAGRWDENQLISMLKRHAFGAVVTAYDPGDPTFDARYLPRTQAALLTYYPKVEKFGDYRLRLP